MTSEDIAELAEIDLGLWCGGLLIRQSGDRLKRRAALQAAGFLDELLTMDIHGYVWIWWFLKPEAELIHLAHRQRSAASA
jgi:hypothetical protein